MNLEGNVKKEYSTLSGKIRTLVIDKTLTISGAAADAHATGERLDALDVNLRETVEIAMSELGGLSAETIREICT